MNVSLILLMLAFQNPTLEDPQNLIWGEISQLETTIKQAVTEDNSNFAISANDPVQGYYISRVGVFLVVPVRYRTSGDMPEQPASDSKAVPNLPQNPANMRISRKDIERRVRAWKQELARSEMVKDANFEKVVSNMKSLIPEVVATLRNLPDEESVMIVIEERIPAWYYAGFSLKKVATRKVVTLTVDKDLISHIDAQETVLAADWLKHVKRTTTNRELATGALGGKSAATED